MVNFPPLFPTTGWFSVFLREYADSFSRPCAIEIANNVLGSPKEFGRYILTDSSGRKQVQSLAVEGGGRQLRTFQKLSRLRLSEHGDWRRVHLGAIEALLGRKPYYRHLENGIKEIYHNRDLQTLEEFNIAIFNYLFSFLMEDVTEFTLKQFRENPVIKERGKEIARHIDSGISLLQAIASYGKEALLGILALDMD